MVTSVAAARNTRPGSTAHVSRDVTSTSVRPTRRDGVLEGTNGIAY